LEKMAKKSTKKKNQEVSCGKKASPQTESETSEKIGKWKGKTPP